MLPQSEQRKKKNSSKVNLLISFTFHLVLVVVLLYFAARSGILGNQARNLAVKMIKEKKELPKPKPPPPPVEPPKALPKIAPSKMETAKAPTTAPTTVAPPATVLPSFDFAGGSAVSTSSDPVQLYKGAMEYAFRAKWDRPDNVDDAAYVAEVQVDVDRAGNISDPQWEKASGNKTWDNSVRKAIAAVKNLDRPPPTNFPPQVVIRFDVQEETASESTFQ